MKNKEKFDMLMFLYDKNMLNIDGERLVVKTLRDMVKR